MATFPDSLPPAGLDPVSKLLIYYGILFVLATAITSWLITRRRSFPKPKTVERDAPPQETNILQVSSVTQSLGFSDDHDRLASLIVEEQGLETAILKLEELRENISAETYQRIKAEYEGLLSGVKSGIDNMQEAPQEEPEEEIQVEELEADLEKQLMDLENDDEFLKPRRKKNIDDIFEEAAPVKEARPKASPPKAATPKAAPPKAATPAASKPAAPKPPAPKEDRKVSMPPPPGKPASNPGASIPAPSSKKVAPPPPPGKSAPSAAAPAPPATKQPLSAAQPMKVETDQDDAMFAKSTSIAALRMDMLRELARLKKLIPEDQEKD